MIPYVHQANTNIPLHRYRQFLRDTPLSDVESLHFDMSGDTQDIGRRSLPRYDNEPPPPFPSESNDLPPRQLRNERQSEFDSPLASKKLNEFSLPYPVNPSSAPSRVSCLITPASFLCRLLAFRHPQVKISNSYSAGTPVAPTHERLKDASPVLQDTFSSLRQVDRLSIYFFTFDMDFRERIRLLPYAVLPIEPLFRPKTPNTTSFSSQFFGGDGLNIDPDDHTSLRSVSPDSSSGHETADTNSGYETADSSSGYETAQEELPPPCTTTSMYQSPIRCILYIPNISLAQKRRRSSECCSSSSAVKRKVRRLESRIRDLEKKEVMADARIKRLESTLDGIHDLLDRRWLERL